MSEKNLWHRIDKAVGLRGHFDRREFNPIAGVPDLSYCVTGVEGHIELKYIDETPSRDTTAVFGPRTRRGMEDEQIAWAERRMRAGGRTYVLAQVEKRLFLFHGGVARTFNELTMPEMRELAMWDFGPTVPTHAWELFLGCLTGTFDPTSRIVSSSTGRRAWTRQR